MLVMSSKEYLKNLFDSAVEDHVFPGYSAAIVTSSEILTFWGGTHTYDKGSLPVHESTLYDVASLTKIVGPMTVMMRLVDSGEISLDDKISKYLPSFSNDPYKSLTTIRHLLTYTIDYDLPEGAKSFMKNTSPKELAIRMMELPFKSFPAKTYIYTNITAFLLTQLIEQITNKNFYDLVKERVFIPCNMSTATFFPNEDEKTLIPPTENIDERGLVQGFVHDEMTFYLQSGGISCGAAGLFASAKDMANFFSTALTFTPNKKPLFSNEMLRNFTSNQFDSLLPTITPLGWGDLNNDLISTHSKYFVVKGGFTGCFMIVDIKNKLGVVLLSNAIYPMRPKDRAAFNQLKTKIFNLLLSNA